MPKLKKFDKKNKMNYKNISISLAVLVGLMAVFGVYRSYAIYKLQQDYDVIKNKIGTYLMGDVRVAVLVDGKEASQFPSYETNYKVESVDCTNGVSATFDVENWQINIADMSASSTKCTVSFNSKETNELTPVNYTKTELVALNEEIKNTSAKELADYLYPVGSIYMSTEDDTIEKVQNKFGGTWVKYSSGTTLVGDDGETYIGNSDDPKNTGGSSTAIISYTPEGTISDYSGNSGSTTLTVSQIPAHTHRVVAAHASGTIAMNFGAGTTQTAKAVFSITPDLTNTYTYYGNLMYAESVGGSQGHTHTINHGHTFTGIQKNIEVSTIQPYTVVYMYKRTA